MTPIMRRARGARPYSSPGTRNSPSRSGHFSDADLDNAVRAVLWELAQEFGLLPGTIRWINVQMSAAGDRPPLSGPGGMLV
jgi:hypothetical protein